MKFIEKIYPYYEKYRLPIESTNLPDSFKSDYFLCTNKERQDFGWFCKDEGAKFHCGLSMDDAIKLENKFRKKHNIKPLIAPIEERKPF